MDSSFAVTIITANLRMLEGCESDAAIDSIMASIEKAGEAFADKYDVKVTIERHYPENQSGSYTIQINHLTRPDEYDGKAEALAGELEEALSAAMEKAIENGAWEDAA